MITQDHNPQGAEFNVKFSDRRPFPRRDIVTRGLDVCGDGQMYAGGSAFRTASPFVYIGYMNQTIEANHGPHGCRTASGIRILQDH